MQCRCYSHSTGVVEPTPNDSVLDFNINDNCIIAWDINGTWKWFVAYITEKLDDDQYVADHLERCLSNNHFQWRYPNQEDKHTINKVQVVPVKVEGDWNVTQNARYTSFMLQNANEIEKKFADFIKKFN